MARPLRIEYPDAYYYVTSRGNERKDIFKTQKDREQFMSSIYRKTTKRNRGVFQSDRIRGFAGKSPRCSGTGERQKATSNN